MNSLLFLETLWQDVRHGYRVLLGNPGYALVAVLTLAVGIGANSAIFSFVDAVLLKPLPYDHADRIVRLAEKRPNGASSWVSTPTFLDWKTDNAAFDKIAAQQDGIAILTGAGDPVPFRVARVTTDYFDVFGIKAFLGRTFAHGEDELGHEKVVVISHAVWQTQFGADPRIVGQTILLDNGAYTVIGVLSSDSAFDRGSAEIWYPLAFRPSNMSRRYRWLSTSFALLKPGVSVEQARSQLDSISARIAREYPDSNKGWGAFAEPYADSIVGPNLRLSLLALMAAVGGLLLICCANLANLALARAVSRGREVAVRASLGASRLRLLQQFLAESMVLSICGGLLGAGVGYAGIAWLKTLIPAGSFPREMSVELDIRVLMFTMVVSVITGLVFGLAPALHATNPALSGLMKDGGRSATSGSSGRWLRDALVVAEVAVAFLLLCGSGLLMRSFFGLLEVDTGFDSTNVLTMRLPAPGFPPGSDYTSPQQFTAYLRELQSSVRAVPGVKQAAFANAVPLTDCCLYGLVMQIANQPVTDRANRGGGFFKVVTPSYFSAMGLTLRSGRFLTEQDTFAGRRVIVINERLAKQYFPNEDPVGQRIFNPEILPGKTESGPDVAWQIVGIVGDEKISALNDAGNAVVYATYEQSPVYFMNLIVQAGPEASSLEKPIRQAIYSVNRSQAILDVRTMEGIKSGSVVGTRFQTVLLTLFSAMALALATIGIYGLIAHSVAQRTQEIGIRAALGASPLGLVRMVLSRGLVLTSLGLVIGAVGVVALMPLVSSILFQVDARDPLTMTSAAVLLILVSLAAYLIPARRVVRIDPVRALQR